MRSDAVKVVVLLTDGKQQPAYFDAVRKSATLYSSLRAKIITIGVTDSVDEKQLLGMSRDKKNVFFVDDFDDLGSLSFIDQVAGTVCDNIEPGIQVVHLNSP